MHDYTVACIKNSNKTKAAAPDRLLVVILLFNPIANINYSIGLGGLLLLVLCVCVTKH